MRLKKWRVFFVASLLCGMSPTPAWAQRMKLLTPNVGWTISGRRFGRQPRLLWTTNGGTDWKDITPPHPNDAVMHRIFFLDASYGWVAFARGDFPGNVRFVLASTKDSGATWSVSPLNMPDEVSGSNFNGGASLSFVDPAHGWLALTTGMSIPGYVPEFVP
jgi:hypothetical protein